MQSLRRACDCERFAGEARSYSSRNVDQSQPEPDVLLHINYSARSARLGDRGRWELQVNSIIYLVGLVVIVMAILSFVGLG
jgi:hypothetical protein